MIAPNPPLVLQQLWPDTDGAPVCVYYVGYLADVLAHIREAGVTLEEVALEAWGGFEVPVMLEWVERVAEANPQLAVSAVVDLADVAGAAPSTTPKSAVFTPFTLSDVMQTVALDGFGGFDNCNCGADHVSACACLGQFALTLIYAQNRKS